MKTKIYRSINLSLSILLFLFISAGLYSQEKERNETIVKEFKVSKETAVKVENKVGEFTFKTWDKDAARLEINVFIGADDAEDIDRTLEALENIRISSSSSYLEIYTQFYDNYISRESLGKDRIRIKLRNGNTVNLRELSVDFVLTLPDGLDLSIANKYEDISFPDYRGRVVFDIYDAQLKSGNLGNDAIVRLRYASADIMSVRDCSMDLYDSKIQVKETGNLELNSKYSEITIGKTGMITFNSYDDKIFIDHHGSLSGEAKYTTLMLNSFDEGVLDLYDCTLNAGQIDMLKLRAKYTKIDLESVRDFDFTESYDNKLNVKTIGALEAVSKYTTFTIDYLASSFKINSYDDKISIMMVDDEFSGISLDSKYTNVDLLMETGTEYELDIDAKYTGLEFPEDDFDEIRYHKDYDALQYLGKIRGSGEGLPSISFRGYDGKLVIRH